MGASCEGERGAIVFPTGVIKSCWPAHLPE